jgi:hypothetical protein
MNTPLFETFSALIAFTRSWTQSLAKKMNYISESFINMELLDALLYTFRSHFMPQEFCTERIRRNRRLNCFFFTYEKENQDSESLQIRKADFR